MTMSMEVSACVCVHARVRALFYLTWISLVHKEIRKLVLLTVRVQRKVLFLLGNVAIEVHLGLSRHTACYAEQPSWK